MTSPMKKSCTVNGLQMSYVESGLETGDPMVFLHGNPTSSYLWRNVMAPLESKGRRLIAPDLIGMGDSDKIPNSGPGVYTYDAHSDFLDKLLECVNVTKNVILVLHDWGSALGFWWAYRNQQAIQGIVYFEALVQPLEWAHFDAESEGVFRALRTPGVGEQLVLEQNIFVESVLPSSIIRNLTTEEMDAYRKPYLTPGESRRPTLSWPREIPINGTPANTANVVATYGNWMVDAPFPKLYIDGNPGAFLTGNPREFCRTWKNQTEVAVSGLHFLQEDSPTEIADAISTWMDDSFPAAEAMTPTSSASIYSASFVPLMIAAANLIRSVWR